MKYILADSCIWVEFFKGSNKDLCEKLERLIIEDRVLLSDIVRSELLVGARNKNELNELRSVFSGLHVAEIDSDIIIKAGELGFAMRKKGFSLPLTDLIIVSQALFHNSRIWTYDKHFYTLNDNLNLDFLVNQKN